MKSEIHPQYREVVFQDTTAGTTFLTRSSIATEETITWEDGNTYPLAKVEISKESHPFFTGTMQIVDTAGRVERFERRYGRRKGEAEASPADAADQNKPADQPKADFAEDREAEVHEPADPELLEVAAAMVNPDESGPEGDAGAGAESSDGAEESQAPSDDA